ncbi:MAG: hypothetical protein KDB23_30790, partial [Planctomycetales bacterium]|nr:hypothetical protein [Planctomycetales bacterium]
DDALALGVRHAAINVNLTGLVDPTGDPQNPSWESGGRRFYFQRGYLESLDRQIKPLSDRGVLVHLILLAYESRQPMIDQIMMHPRFDSSCPNHLSAFNTVTDDGRAWFVALCEFLAERWSRPDQAFGRAVGYIVGNEVNSHWWWSNMGRVSLDDFLVDYERTVRLAHSAIRSQSSWARVYVSLEHHWNIRYPAGDKEQSFAGREFLEKFAARCRAQGDFDWHLAFHPYPENLFEPRFWLDKSALDTADTPRITFKNLPQLTAFMQQESMHFAGQPRHIILSEQGFHTPAGNDGELIQAAAYCYAYRLVENEPAIDAFILHRHVDNAHEGGLLLGLRSNQARGDEALPKKRSYACFQAADTPDWRAAFEFALPVIGLDDWP